MRRIMLGTFWVAISVLGQAALGAGANDYGLTEGSAALQSAGPLAFGPKGVLFVGDTKAAAVVAIAIDDASTGARAGDLQVDDVGSVVAKALETSPQDLQVQDLAVNPDTGNVYLSVMVGGENAKPAIVKIDQQGAVTPVDLHHAAAAKAQLPDAPADAPTGEGRGRRNNRAESITDLAFVDGFVIVSGLSAADSPSNVRSLAFPFAKADPGTSLEIFHGAHGRVEDNAPIRTFVPFNIDGEPNLLAGFTCTPLVKFPLSQLEPGKKVRGTTVAELGNRNRPLDMIVYKKGGKNFLLMANSSRGVMKINTENIERPEGINEPVRGGGTAGQSYETIVELKGVVQLDRINDERGIVLVQSDSGTLDLKTIELP